MLKKLLNSQTSKEMKRMKVEDLLNAMGIRPAEVKLTDKQVEDIALVSDVYECKCIICHTTFHSSLVGDYLCFECEEKGKT